MDASQSKLIIGTEPRVTRALMGWMLVAPHDRYVSVLLDRHAIDYLDFSSLDAFEPKDTTAFLAMDDSMLNLPRQAAFDYLEKAGFAMPAFLHPQCLIDPRVKPGKNWAVGQGSLIAENVTCGSNLALGAGAALHHGSEIGHHVTIGESAHIGPQCRLGDCVTVGAFVTLLEGCTIGPQSRITKPGYYKGHHPAGTFIVEEFSAMILG